MKIYILDVQGKGLEQMLQWLSENKKVKAVEVFADYIKFIDQVGKSLPDFCVIRLGSDEIPGLKAADMVQQISTDIRIVFVSDDRGYAVDAYEVGAYGYLLCPIDRKKFENYLERKK